MNSGIRQPSGASLRKLYKGINTPGRPLVFLDFDDVIYINKPYGGHGVLRSQANVPNDLCERLCVHQQSPR